MVFGHDVLSVVWSLDRFGGFHCGGGNFLNVTRTMRHCRAGVCDSGAKLKLSKFNLAIVLSRLDLLHCCILRAGFRGWRAGGWMICSALAARVPSSVLGNGLHVRCGSSIIHLYCDKLLCVRQWFPCLRRAVNYTTIQLIKNV